MSTDTQAAWPRNGFEPLFGYVSDFIHLNINLGGPTQCKAYHDRWMRRYSTAMANWSDFEVAVWSVRLRQSLKLAFSATFFALSADVVGERKIKAAEYYLAYYAMLHAMWAVIYLHPEQSIEHVTSITHSKMSHLFHAEFASGTGRIIVEDVKALAQDLRFLREYYSYRMPLNSPFDAHSELSLSYARLGGFVKQSIQLANLHSHMLRKIGEKTKKAGARIAPNDVAKFSDAFYDMNAKKHIGREYLVLDDADSRARSEFLEHGCDLLPLSIGYDYMFDNFMTWDHERPDEKLLQRVRALVGGALF